MSDNKDPGVLLKEVKKVSEEPISIWFWYIVIAIIILWVAFYGLNIFVFKLKPNEQGDAFGAWNTLFSGFAFLGVIYAILLQRNELKLQREELSMTREELKGSKEALEVQNKTQEIQQFENTFFNFLNFYMDQRKIIQSNYKIDRVFTEITTSIQNNTHSSESVETQLNPFHELFDIKVEIIEFIFKSGIEDDSAYIKTLKSLSSVRERLLFKCYVGTEVIMNNPSFKDMCVYRYNFWENNFNLEARLLLQPNILNELDRIIGWD